MSEHLEQCALIRWFDMKYNDHKGRLYATPNAGKRHIAVGRKLKAEGMRAGVPDLCLPVSRLSYNSLYIELKTKEGKVSDSQKGWIEYLNSQGNMAVVCYGWESAKEVISKYLDSHE